jgi:hypothetical protein
MKQQRKRIVKRLIMEELEERAMLADTPSPITSGSMNDIYASLEGVGPEVPLPTAAAYVPQFGAISFGPADPNLPADYAPGAVTGVGQMTITTGANTPGISSFAYPTAGPSRAGGTGNAMLGHSEAELAQAVDEAIRSFSEELQGSNDSGSADADESGQPAKSKSPPESKSVDGQSAEPRRQSQR